MKKIISLLLAVCFCLSIGGALLSCQETASPKDTKPSLEATESKTASTTEDIKYPESEPIIIQEGEKVYLITYSARQMQNDSVGDSWDYGVIFENKDIYSGALIATSLSEELTLTLYAVEYDETNDDYGSEIIAFSDMAANEKRTEVKIVEVKENSGRYFGNAAQWEFTVICTCVEINLFCD